MGTQYKWTEKNLSAPQLPYLRRMIQIYWTSPLQTGPLLTNGFEEEMNFIVSIHISKMRRIKTLPHRWLRFFFCLVQIYQCVRVSHGEDISDIDIFIDRHAPRRSPRPCGALSGIPPDHPRWDMDSRTSTYVPFMNSISFALALSSLHWPRGSPLTHKTWQSDGRHIQAHGAGVIVENGTYYLIGEDKTDGTPFQNVNCYASTDLVNWDYVGALLTRGDSGDLGPDRIVERPKVIYNDATGKYVLWMHIDSRDYGDARAGVATGDSVCGQYGVFSFTLSSCCLFSGLNSPKRDKCSGGGEDANGCRVPRQLQAV